MQSRFTRIFIPGCEINAGVRRERGQKRTHAFDFVSLIVDDVIGESKEDGIISGARLFCKFFHHGQRAFMVPDH